jgi:D-alanyl-D-alanine carboxypeptidase
VRHTPTAIALLSLGCAPVDPELVHQLDDVLDDHDLPGLAVVLRVRGERVFHVALGEADVETGARMRTDTRVRIGSITKTMTGLALAELDHRGVLDLDGPVSDWVGDLPDGDQMRIRDLATHHSGLRNFQDIEEYKRSEHKPWSAAELLRIATVGGLKADPGSTYVYSATGFLVAGMVLEAATGLPWHAAITQTLGTDTVAPGLGLPRASSVLAQGHLHGEPVMASASADNGRAAAALAASADDLDALLHELESGRLIAPDAWEEARFPHVDRGRGLRYGLGVTHDGWRYGHRGRVLGYVAAWRHIIDDDTTIVVTANGSDVSSVGIEEDVWEILEDYGYVD